MALPSVLVLGASGFLGEYVCRELLRQRSKFARVAILTQESKKLKFRAIESEGMEIILGSYLSSSSFQGFDTVYSLLGNHVMKDQPSIIDAAIEAGVTEFYPSEFGGDISQGPYLTNRYFRDKHITRAHLEKAVKAHPGFNYTLIIVGAFVEFVLNPASGFDLEKHTFTIYGSPGKESPFTATADAAKYLVESTLMPKNANGGGRVFRVVGGLYSWEKIVRTVSAVQGVEYTSTYLPNEEAVKAAAECAKRGDVDGELTYSLKALIGDVTTVPVPKPWDNDKFSFRPESLEDALQRCLSSN